MADIDILDTDYLTGFNEGHLLAKHMPELADKLASVVGNSNRGIGFQDGRQEFLLEQRREKYPSWRNPEFMDKEVSPELEEKDLDKDIQDPEPEG